METGSRGVTLLALGLCASLCSVGCASSRQAAGVGLIIVGTVAAAAGMAANDVINEIPDPSQPVSARTCLDQCTRGSDSAVDALLVAGGAAAVLAGETLVNTAPTKAPGGSGSPSSPAAPAPPPQYAPAPAAPAPAPAAPAPAAPASPAAPAAGSAAPGPEPVAPSPTRCLGPLREPALVGCAP